MDSSWEIHDGSPDDEPERRETEKLHWVNLTNGFWLAETACTQSFWKEVMGDDPSYFKGNVQINNLPVDSVSWSDCQAMIAKLNHHIPQLVFSLPTEAQWEYACRAGTTTPFSFGMELTTEQVNYNGKFSYNNQSKGERREYTLPVYSLQPNSWGLYQMHGNLWEWCQDWLGSYPEVEVNDPSGPKMGRFHVLRGGSWYAFGTHQRSAYRDWIMADGTYGNTGVRLAMVYIRSV